MSQICRVFCCMLCLVVFLDSLGVSHHFQEKKKVGVASKSDLLLFLLCDDALFVLLKARHFSKENDFPSLSIFFDGALLLAVAGGGSMTRTIYSIFTRKKGFF